MASWEEFMQQYGEPALSMFSGAIAEPVSGLSGLVGLGVGVDESVQLMDNIRDAMTYQPRSAKGQQTMGDIGYAMEPIGEAFENLNRNFGDTAFDLTGSPGAAAAATAIPEAILSLPFMSGARAAKNYPNVPSSGMGGRQKGQIQGATPKTGYELAMETAQKNAALPKEQGGLDLPADNTPFQRAQAMNFDMDEDWFHGTTHDPEVFLGPDAPTANPEGFYGAGNYLTSDPYDASVNYAGIGPDLEGRIIHRAERIASERDWDYDDPRAKVLATDELKGETGGQVMPVVIRSENPMNLTSDNPSQVGYDAPDFENFMDEAREQIDIEDYKFDEDLYEAFQDGGDNMDIEDVVDMDEYRYDLEDKARELADEDAAYRDPEGTAAEMRDSYAYNAYVDDGAGIFDDAADSVELYSGGADSVDARDLMAALRERSYDFFDDEGRSTGPDVMAQAAEDAGFSSILMDASETFPHMDMNYGTQHQIIRDPSRIRSRFAAFDPKKKDSGNLLAGLAAAGVSIPALMQMFEEEQQGL